MKNVIVICCLILLHWSCQNDPTTPSGASPLLRQVTVNGKPYHTFEYQNGQLIKENFFGLCEKNPSDEFFYTYQGQKLTNLKSVMRSLYSSSTAMCDPASAGEQSAETYEYDAQNRLTRVNRSKSYTLYTYNSAGQVEQSVLYGGANPLVATFKYDAKGNIVETTDYSGQVIRYEYDGKPNPFYLIRQKPGWISAFNTSPNNMVKATWVNGGYIRSFKYNTLGLPSSIQEDNGQTYYFEYQ